MKKYVTTQRDVKLRKQIDCSGPSLTDQSFKKAVDINNIVAKFQKTGILPEEGVGVYGDFSSIPSLEEAHEAIQKATDQFYALPATLRKEMENDPSKLELWLSDDSNYEKALQYGLVEAKVVEQPTDTVGNVNSTTDNTTTTGGTNASVSN